jgi:hypothetical protein
MSFVPSFKLYASDGVTLLYTFVAVQSTNAPQAPKKSNVVEGIRGKGCIVIPGADSSWDLEISGIFMAADYSALDTLMASLESTVVLFTNYILIFDKTISTSYTYNVQRVLPIEFSSNGNRTNYQEYRVILKVGAW